MVRPRVSKTGLAMPPSLASVSCRGLSPASSHPRTPERAAGGIPATLGTSPRTGKRRDDNSLLHTDRERHVVGGDGRHQIQDVVVLGVLLDAEVIHVLQRLMVLLAEGHGTLGRVEGEVLHGGDQLLGVGE